MSKVLHIDSARPDDQNPAGALPDDIRCLEDRLAGEYNPATPTEEILVRQLAVLAWRLGKMPAYEAARMRDFESPSESAGEAWPQILRLWRHQSAFLNQFQSTLRELRKLQASRLSAVEAPVFPMNFMELLRNTGSPAPDTSEPASAPPEASAAEPPPQAAGPSAPPELQSGPRQAGEAPSDSVATQTPSAAAAEPSAAPGEAFPLEASPLEAPPDGPRLVVLPSDHQPLASVPPEPLPESPGNG